MRFSHIWLRYQITIFWIQMLIGLSRLLHSYIAYEIDTAKIVAAFIRFSYCLHDLIRVNSIVFHGQTTRCTVTPFSLIDSAINWQCLVLIGLSRLLHAYIAYDKDTLKIFAAFFRIYCWFHDLIRLHSIVCYVQTTRCTMMPFSLIDSAMNWQCFEYEFWQGYLDTFMLMLDVK